MKQELEVGCVGGVLTGRACFSVSPTEPPVALSPRALSPVPPPATGGGMSASPSATSLRTSPSNGSFPHGTVSCVCVCD